MLAGGNRQGWTRGRHKVANTQSQLDGPQGPTSPMKAPGSAHHSGLQSGHGSGLKAPHHPMALTEQCRCCLQLFVGRSLQDHPIWHVLTESKWVSGIICTRSEDNLLF